MEAQLYDELLVELECPICTNYMSPPIRQCATGHNICCNCLKRLLKCPLCQGQFTESRNISLEGLATKMRYPCINKNLGCPVKLSYTEREIHEMKCPLKGYKCAMEKCPWRGRIEELRTHWASKKMSSKPYHANNVCHTKMKAESYYVNMVDAYDKLFWFKCKLIKNKLYWAVQFIGNAAEAENYIYQIEIIKPGRTEKKILLGDYCQSIELENSQLFTNEACICIDTESVGSFVGAEQILIYYMRLGKSSEVPSGSTTMLTAKKENKHRDRSQDPAGQRHKNFKKKQAAKGGKKDDFVVL